MKILITGGKGMLGKTLQRHLSPAHQLLIADLPEIDILHPEQLTAAVKDFSPDVIIHCAAMVQVDACETHREQAFLLNETGSRNVAEAAKACHAWLIAISTDYVFDGTSNRPYREDDLPVPATVYGASKLAGERAITSVLPDRSTIVRIAWLYGGDGPSFVHTMLRLGADENGEPLKVVQDQQGNPTSTDAVAALIEWLLDHPLVGVVHGSCEGETTWYGFTCEIFRQMGYQRKVNPCTTREFPRPAPRPANSRLEKARLHKAGYPMPDWHDALTNFLEDRRKQ